MNRRSRDRPTLWEESARRRQLSHHFYRLYTPKTTIDNRRREEKNVVQYRSRSAQPTLEDAYTKGEMRRNRIKAMKGANGDIMDRRFYEFAQPSKDHMPRTLLINNAKSKVAANRRVYQGPILPKRDEDLSKRKSSSEPINDDKLTKKPSMERLSIHHRPRLTSSYSSTLPWGQYEVDDDFSSARSSADISIESPLIDGRLIDNDDGVSNQPKKTNGNAQLELDELIRRITQEIVDNSVFSESTILHIVNRHIMSAPLNMNRRNLNEQVAKLLSDIGVSSEQFSTAHAEPSKSTGSSVQNSPSVSSATTSSSASKLSSRKSGKLQESIESYRSGSNKSNTSNESNKSNSRSTSSSAETNRKESTDDGSIPLTDKDIDDILKGKNINKIAAKLDLLRNYSTSTQGSTESPEVLTHANIHHVHNGLSVDEHQNMNPNFGETKQADHNNESSHHETTDNDQLLTKFSTASSQFVHPYPDDVIVDDVETHIPSPPFEEVDGYVDEDVEYADDYVYDQDHYSYQDDDYDASYDDAEVYAGYDGSQDYSYDYTGDPPLYDEDDHGVIHEEESVDESVESVNLTGGGWVAEEVSDGDIHEMTDHIEQVKIGNTNDTKHQSPEDVKKKRESFLSRLAARQQQREGQQPSSTKAGNDSTMSDSYMEQKTEAETSPHQSSAYGDSE